MTSSALADAAASTTVNQALLPGFLDPITLLGYFGTWALVGLLAVILIESGVLFPVLPGDSLLFVAGLVAAGESAEVARFASLWQLLVFIPVAAIIGGQIGYWIGRYAGTTMFKPGNRFLKERYLAEAHEFFERRGPVTIFLARFVPIVRTLAPIVAGAARMNFALFTAYNVIGAIVWGCGITLLGYWLGQFAIIQKLIEPIFILIVLVSVIPIFWEYYKRRRAEKANAAAAGVPEAAEPELPRD
ncbi:DedA family protein [Williamsia sp. SKLECPSW1]